MSFIHYTLVGHFHPQVWRGNKSCTRPIDAMRLNRILAEYPEAVAACVSLQDGYARCQWVPAPRGVGDQVREFAYRLAREEGCMAVENGREITYPPEAVLAQREDWKKWQEQISQGTVSSG
jgi:hypothetical protein